MTETARRIGCGRASTERVLLSIALSILVASFSRAAAAQTPEESLQVVLASPDYVELSQIDGIAIDLRYASDHNFLGKNVYGHFDRAFLRKPAAEKLRRAVTALRERHPGWKIVVFDALRPRSVQRLFWAEVVGTPKQPYVADPDKGSVHNYGFALDVSLLDESGHELDMGTRFDDFSELAEPRREAELLRRGKLTPLQIDHRLVLRKAMTTAGFVQLPVEWWHYDAIPSASARAGYSILE